VALLSRDDAGINMRKSGQEIDDESEEAAGEVGIGFSRIWIDHDVLSMAMKKHRGIF
jgi:hypothetical protein